MRHTLFGIGIVVFLLASFPSSPLRAEEGWTSLFDGKSLKGWTASENPGTFHVEDGCIVADGPRSHLFYQGDPADFRNFELRAEVMTRPGANSGIYFHTAYQEKGWPQKGFEVQINNSHVGEGKYRERKKTGSLYGIRNVYKAMIRDREWFTLSILVQGKRVQVKLNERLVVDYLEPEAPATAGEYQERFLSHGTFALQGHDPHSYTRFRKVDVRRLPDGLSAGQALPTVDDRYLEILRLNQTNFPMINAHVHLKGALTLEGALAESWESGIFYGIALNCGKGFPVESDHAAKTFLQEMAGQPVFLAMQAEGREWRDLFSASLAARFDYIFTDAMTFTDEQGKRTRLWMKNEVEIKDPQAFMEMYVRRIVKVLDEEPIDIYVNPTFLPGVIAADYNRLWTPERMKKVVDAARNNGVAVEINDRYRIPSAAFIKMAKSEQVKFSFGTNNADKPVGRLIYCLDMMKECGLTAADMFTPPDSDQKAAVRKKDRFKKE